MRTLTIKIKVIVITLSVLCSYTMLQAAETNTVSLSRGIYPPLEQSEHTLDRGVEQRTYQGHNNNQTAIGMGSAYSQLERWIPHDYSDAIAAPAGVQRPSPRMISNYVNAQHYSRPNPVNASDFLWQWGQFLDHDIDLTDGTNPPELMPISVPVGDVYFDPANTGTALIMFNRSIYDVQTGDTPENPREQINQITAWIDGSNVYGSDLLRANALRTLDGTGKLKTSPGNFLPYNVEGLPNAGGNSDALFLAGDVRANEQFGLLAMHTLFMREHNRLAQQIAQQFPAYNDEQIYQHARHLVGAIIQFITYNEFLPLLLGPESLTAYTGYNPQVNADISSAFSTAAFRFGHSALSPLLRRVSADGSAHSEGDLNLLDVYFSPHLLVQEGSFDAVLRGLASQVCQNIDVFVIDDVRNFLFGAPGQGGMDLASLNIQRGRDHGLQGYTQAREMMGLAPVIAFSQINSDPAIQTRLSNAYSEVSGIDLWVGALAEEPVADALVGELLHKLITKQFTVLRDGDRFWYQHYLNPIDLALVETSTLASVIRRNSAIEFELGDNAFVVEKLIDTDQDTIVDIRDNCLSVINTDQLDGDRDGYGNACDADFNNDGRVNFGDMSIFAATFLSTDPVTDINGDGIVNYSDLDLFRQQFLLPPGPSGLHW